MKTTSIKPPMIKKKWLIVDASDQVLGRLSTEIARALMGKTKPDYVAYLDTGDNVVVINAGKIRLTGNKLKKKIYYRHSGYAGNIRSATAETIKAKYPERLIEESVKGMLPKGAMGRHLFLNLKVYAGAEHPHAAQNPQPMGPRVKGAK